MFIVSFLSRFAVFLYFFSLLVSVFLSIFRTRSSVIIFSHSHVFVFLSIYFFTIPCIISPLTLSHLHVLRFSSIFFYSLRIIIPFSHTSLCLHYYYGLVSPQEVCESVSCVSPHRISISLAGPALEGTHCGGENVGWRKRLFLAFFLYSFSVFFILLFF